MRNQLRSLTALAVSLLFTITASAQLSVTATNTAFTVDFEGTLNGVNNAAYDGTQGLDAAPVAGQLDSDAWEVTGLSDGNTSYGGTHIGGDYDRGGSAGGVTTGGMYSFDTGGGNSSFGIQGSGSDMTPGTITLKVDNNTGGIVNVIDLSYLIYEYNDQARLTSLNFSYSTDDVAYTPVGALDFTSTGPAAAAWLSFNRSTQVTGLGLANGASFYLRWTIDDAGGSGGQDELAIDDITVTMAGAGASTTEVDFSLPNSATVAETVGTTDLTLEITNPDGTNATSVDVVLISGDATRINNYTTQNVNWVAGDGTDKTVTITVTDDGLLNGDEVLTFELQNASGGNSAAVGSVSQFVLTVQDDEVPTSVQFSSTSNSVTETGVTYDITVSITDPSGTVATTADVVLLTGDAARINGYTTQMVTFPAGSSADQTVTVTITDDGLCNGKVNHYFELQNVAGGNSAAAGANTLFQSVLNDDEGISADESDDFETGAVLSPAWVEGTPGDWTSSTTTPINGTYSLKHNLNGVSGNSNIARSTNVDLNSGDNTWRLQIENGNWDPSTSNRFWYWLSANETDLSSTTIDGYAVGVNYNGSDDLLSLWRVTGNGGTQIITSTFDWDANTVAGIEVTRDFKGNWELLIDGNGGFDNLVSAGTVSDNTHSLNVAMGPEFFFTSTRAGLLWFDDIQYAHTACFVTYYSQGSGDVTDAIWDVVPVGTPGAAVFSPTATVVIQNSHVVTQNIPVFEVERLVVECGEYSCDPGMNTVKTRTGFQLDGTLSGDPVLFECTSYFTDYTASTNRPVCGLAGYARIYGIHFHDAAAPNAQITGTGLRIVDELYVGSANVDILGLELVLESSVANGTARISDLTNGSLLNATNVTMERVIPAGVTNWRTIATCIESQTLDDVNDDFFTAGFTGSNYPIFHVNNDPMLPLWPSIRSYDETDPGSVLLDGLVGPTDINDVMPVGQGFAAWAGDNFNTTTEFVIDFNGTVNQGFTNIPMSYTNTGDVNVDGWNLVGNPKPSPIDFGGIIKGADVDNNYYVFDPISGNNAAWNESTQTSIPSGALNGNIQSSQGFWLHATGTSNSVSVPENAKVYEPIAGGLFGGSQQVNAIDMMRLEISSTINSYFDEAVVVFNAGTDVQDSNDMLKFIFDNGASPQIATESSDGQTLVYNDWGTFTSDISIPVQVDVPITGTYTIKAYDAESVLGLTCFTLEDTQTGQLTTLSEGATYDFTIDENDPATPARFILHASAPAELATTEVLCAGGSTGEASITNPTNTTWNVEWVDANGMVIQTQSVTNGTVGVTGLEAGEYMVNISGGCGNLSNEFMISQPSYLGSMSNVMDATCSSVNDGSVDLSPMGGVAPYSFLWSNGSTDEDQMNIGSGSYDVTITDANGCEHVETGIVVSADDNPVAAATASSMQVLVGEVIQFTNQSTGALSQQWDMGDGTVYPDFEVTHAYALPGTYTVTLIVEIFGCQSTTTIDIEVSTSTSVEDLEEANINAFIQGENLVVSWTSAGYVGQLYNLTGQAVGDVMRFNGDNGTLIVGMQGRATGVYLLNLTNGSDTRTIRIPLVR